MTSPINNSSLLLLPINNSNSKLNTHLTNKKTNTGRIKLPIIITIPMLTIIILILYYVGQLTMNTLENSRLIMQHQQYYYRFYPRQHNDEDIILEQQQIQRDKVEFQKWIIKYAKSYSSEEETASRFRKFQFTLRKIEHRQQKDAQEREKNIRYVKAPYEGYKIGLTAYSDMTDDEFMEHFNLNGNVVGEKCYDSNPPLQKKREGNSNDMTYSANLTRFTNIDWRNKGWISPIKSQNGLPSWAFATTGALEAYYNKKYQPSVNISFSEQQLLNCVSEGGIIPVHHGFEYIQKYGLLFEHDFVMGYPKNTLVRKNEIIIQTICNKEIKSAIRIKNYVKINNNELELMSAVMNNGPVIASIHITPELRLYKSGIFYSSRCKGYEEDNSSGSGSNNNYGMKYLNHVVLIVGFGIKSATLEPYWIIKNSWGTEFGMDGYFLLRRDGGLQFGFQYDCGLTQCAWYPVLY
jgi:C1A family cysteine protease